MPAPHFGHEEWFSSRASSILRAVLKDSEGFRPVLIIARVMDKMRGEEIGVRWLNFGIAMSCFCSCG